MKAYPFVLLSLLCLACSAGSEPTQPPTTATAPPAPSPAPSPVPIDTVQGIGRYRFGEAMSAFPPLVLVHQSRPTLASYRLAAETGKLRYGPLKLGRSMFSFYRGKLYAITVFAPGPAALRQLTAEATARYGKPTQEPGEMPSWRGEQVLATIGRSPLDSTETYFLKLLSVPVLHQLELEPATSGSH